MNKRVQQFLILYLFPYWLFAQDITVINSLPNTVNETSGLILLDERLITHNDSGGETSLYEVDRSSGKVMRKVTINDATNVDWEDLDMDNTNIYIGDFGNNNGTRKDLRIYIVDRSSYLDPSNVAAAQVINFSYEDQTDFTSAPMNTNFDAEALIAYGDYLYIFTKNWVDRKSNIYRIPKTPGTYIAEKIDLIDPNGLITGATYNALAGKVVLSGYRGLTPFVVELSSFSGGIFSNGLIEMYDLQIPFGYSFQVEGIATTGTNDYYLSAEENALGKSVIYGLAGNTLATDEIDLDGGILYPNPVDDFLNVDVEFPLNKLEIYDSLGKRILVQYEDLERVSLQDLPNGVYFVKLHSETNTLIKKMVKE